jgi:hypothetical protein
MSDKLDKILKLKSDYQKKVREEGEVILKEMFADFFANNPDVNSLRFEAYTPYFNDGEPCVFGVNEVRVSFSSVKALKANLDDDHFIEKTYEKSKTPNRWGGYDQVEVGQRPLDKEEVKSLLEEGGDYQDGYFDSYSLKNETLKKSLSDINNLLGESEDIIQMILGDHIQVTITKNSIDVDEYNHD